MNAHGTAWSEQASPATKKESAINYRNATWLPLTTAVMLSFMQATAQETDGASEDGKLAFNTSCRTCHSIDKGDNRLGPNLHGLIGRKAGSEEYGYSQAMSASNVVWDAKTLERFIENPNAVVPGNNMKPFGGISDPKIRASIVQYLSDPE
jgi:cytochrome c